jgi:DNA (cytosine-5)-methyltransferase 1
VYAYHQESPSVIDLFSGAGGFSLGFEKAGFHIGAAFDIWGSAAVTYRANFTHPIHEMDLSNIDEASCYIRDNYPYDIIIGGPPCQDFSHAGKRIEADRANLTVAFASIVDRLRPHYFVMENVGRAKTTNSYREAREIFKSSGYGLIEMIPDASLYGVPQRRKRLIVIGGLDRPDNFIAPAFDTLASTHPMTVRDYMGGSLDIEHYYRHPRNYTRRAIFSIDEPSPTIRGVNRPIPGTYVSHPGDSCAVGSGVRPLTTQERAMIQTFPENFVWCGSKTDQEQQIGNAIPVRLAYKVARYLQLDIREASPALVDTLH